jgi:methionyl-tRNA formyltransferase
MKEAMAKLEADELTLTPQPEEGVVYAAKIAKDETRVDFTRSAADVHNHIRGLSPFPGTWFELEIAGRIERIKVLGSEPAAAAGSPGTVLDDALTIACGEGAVRPTRLQRAGGKSLATPEFLRGTPIGVGTRIA